VYFVTMKRAGYCLFSVSPSERFGIGLLDDQQRVHVLERDGNDYVVRHEWPIAECPTPTPCSGSARWRSPARSPSSSARRKDAEPCRGLSRGSGCSRSATASARLRDEAPRRPRRGRREDRGARRRRRAPPRPLPDDTPHPERSGLFLYLNANKRGITLDLTRPAGRAAFDRLVDDATCSSTTCTRPTWRRTGSTGSASRRGTRSWS
jgi:hypothetical protein